MSRSRQRSAKGVRELGHKQIQERVHARHNSDQAIDRWQQKCASKSRGCQISLGRLTGGLEAQLLISQGKVAPPHSGTSRLKKGDILCTKLRVHQVQAEIHAHKRISCKHQKQRVKHICNKKKISKAQNVCNERTIEGNDSTICSQEK